MPRAVNQKVSRLFRRASWSVVDQGLSAASNLLLSVIVARTLSAGEFGAFAIAFLIFGLLIATTRATIGQPLQITFSGATEADWKAAVRSALGASVVLGGVAGLVVGGTGLALSNATGYALAAVAVCLPGLLAQDVCRMAFFSSGRAKQAALNDGLWTLLEFAALGAMLLLGVHDVGAFILAWGGSATLAAVAGFGTLRLRPRFAGCLRWMLGQRRLTGYLLAEHILGEGLTQLGVLAVGAVGTPSDVGSLRAGQVLLGPLNVLVTAASVFGIPEIARRTSWSPRLRQRFCWALSGGVCVVTLLYAGLVLVLPPALGSALLGDTWVGAQSVLLPLSVLALAVAVGVGPGVTLYGMGRARTTFGLNLLKGPVLLVLLSAGIWQGGAVGAAWALAATEALILPLLIVKARAAILAVPGEQEDDSAVAGAGLGGAVADAAVLVGSGDHEDEDGVTTASARNPRT